MPPAGPPPRRAVPLRALLAMSAMSAAFAAQLVGALLPLVPVLIAGTLGGLALDLYARLRCPGLLAALSKVRCDVVVRQLLRDILVLVGLLRIDGISPLREQAPLALALLALYATHFVCQAVAMLVRRARTLPVVTRNIDASAALRLSPAPPRLLARRPAHRLLAFSVPGTLGLMATAATADAAWGGAGLGASLVMAVGGTLHLARWLLPGRRIADERRALEWLDAWLAEYRPTVGLYFSGGTSSAYQANMWLTTLARLEGRPLIVLRERFMVQRIDATDVPIVCIPKVAHLLRLERSTLKVLLHPANSGKTSQVLRIPTIKHAFINHGESDKLSSCNPYAKAYDEVWVAGPAARERYRLADIGVDDRDVVEVGRPQLDPGPGGVMVPRARPAAEACAPGAAARATPEEAPGPGRPLTVLYAPTWEGWTEDPGNTSVMMAGERIVRDLIAEPGVRLLYRPHPLTGSVDPRAGLADRRIREMIAIANGPRRWERAADDARATAQRRERGGRGGRPGAHRADPAAAGSAELRRLAERIDELTRTAFRPSADEAERMLVQGAPDGGRAEAVAAAVAAWEAAYWASRPADEHRVVTGPRPGLHSCFARTDLLISDVSSVVSDYVASGKPYAVVNTSGMREADFREAYVTVRAATILTPRGEGLREALDAVRDPARDTLARARVALKEHLLGPDEPTAMERFDAAVRRLGAKADARRALSGARRPA
ncbi:hypothetical protein [Streptomyces sp. URMC 123]|uniref:hypothetical protein n=1 Tax=Streptomyces sp. URMC 123 TaxID=3423403 RepID=UPI003F1D19BD